MAEFADNNAKSSATQMIPFFLNKGFHPRMSFDADPSNPSTSRERLQVKRAGDITTYMQKALEMARKALQNTREAMIKSANKKRKEVPITRGTWYSCLAATSTRLDPLRSWTTRC
jgi:hypothetical protein